MPAGPIAHGVRLLGCVWDGLKDHACIVDPQLYLISGAVFDPSESGRNYTFIGSGSTPTQEVSGGGPFVYATPTVAGYSFWNNPGGVVEGILTTYPVPPGPPPPPNPLFYAEATLYFVVENYDGVGPLWDAYRALVERYHFGVPIITDRAPAELAAFYGLTLITTPITLVGGPTILSAVPTVVPGVHSDPSLRVLFGQDIPVDQVSGTLAGVNYTDPNGVLHPDVDWAWQISVELFVQPDFGTAGTGEYDQEVVTYTGDGTSNRLIPTTFPLNTGVVAIHICGGVGPGITDINCFRHNGAAMLGTAVAGLSQTVYDTTVGIMAFQAGGFTVTPGTIPAGFANQSGVKYTAVVMRDTTTDNRYLRVGSYTGIDGLLLAVSATLNSPNITWVSGTKFNHAWDGLTITDPSGNSYIFHYDTPTTAHLGSPYLRPSQSPVNLQLSGDGYVIAAPNAGSIANAPTVTHAWVWGETVAYRSNDFTGDTSVTLAPSATTSIGGRIKSLGAAVFTIGTEHDVNQLNKLYDFAVLCTGDGTLASLFKSFKGTGTASPPFVVTGLGFTAALAVARRYNMAASQTAIWRGPDHTGTDSALCYKLSANDQATGGIQAIGTGTLDIGNIIAPNASDFYGWAFKGSGSYVIPGDYAPSVPPNTPTGPGVAPNAPPTGFAPGFPVSAGGSGTGFPASPFPAGTGSVDGNGCFIGCKV